MAEDSGADSSNEPNRNEPQNKALSPHERLYHLSYGFGVTLLFSVADFAFLWPESHSGALLFLAAALSILTLYELTVVYPSRTWVKVTIIAVIWLFALLARWVRQRGVG